MRIAAVDPGKTCGIARVGTEDLDSFTSLELPAFEAINIIEMFLPNIDLIVIEDFRIGMGTVKKTRQYDALYTIGAIKYLAWKARVDVDMRLPGERDFATFKRLKQMGWRNPSKGDHQDNAAQHLLVTLIRLGVVDPAQFLKEDA